MPKDVNNDQGLGQAITEGHEGSIQQVDYLLGDQGVSADCYCTSGWHPNLYSLNAALLRLSVSPEKSNILWPIIFRLLAHGARFDANSSKTGYGSPMYRFFQYTYEFALVFLLCNPNSTRIAQDMNCIISRKRAACSDKVQKILGQHGYDFASLPSAMERLAQVMWEQKKENHEASKQEPMELFNDIQALGDAGLRLFRRYDLIAKDLSALNEDNGYRTIPSYFIDYFALRLLQQATSYLKSFLKSQRAESGHLQCYQDLLHAILIITERNKDTHIPLPTEEELKHYKLEYKSAILQRDASKRWDDFMRKKKENSEQSSDAPKCLDDLGISILRISSATEHKAKADAASTAALLKRRPGYLLPSNKEEKHDDQAYGTYENIPHPPGGLKI
jgi:hypothetical protein